MSMSKTLVVIHPAAYSIAPFRGDFLRAAIARGWKALVLAPDYDRHTAGEVEALGAQPIAYSLSRTGLNPVRDLLDTWRLARLLRRLAPQAVLSCMIKPVIFGMLAARLARVPRRIAMIEGAGFVFIDRGAASIGKRLLRVAVRLLYRLALRQAHGVLLLNRDDRELFVGSGMVKAEKVVPLPGIGVNLAAFPCTPLPDGPMTFTFVGRMLIDKGVRDFVAAASAVKRQHPQVRFLMVGALDANPTSIGEDDVMNWVRSGLIEWPGQVADVRPWLTQTSVFVLPSYREGLPRSTQEAMAMGRPVITTDAPGCRETVEDGVNGFLVPVRDPEKLARVMLRFVEEPALIVRMGAASRRIAEQRYDVHRINARLLHILGIAPLDP